MMKNLSPFWDQVPDSLRCALCRFPYERAVKMVCCGTLSCRNCVWKKLRYTHLFCWVRTCFAKVDPDSQDHVISAREEQKKLAHFLEQHPKIAKRLQVRHGGIFRVFDSEESAKMPLPDLSNGHKHRVPKERETSCSSSRIEGRDKGKEPAPCCSSQVPTLPPGLDTNELAKYFNQFMAQFIQQTRSQVIGTKTFPTPEASLANEGVVPMAAPAPLEPPTPTVVKIEQDIKPEPEPEVLCQEPPANQIAKMSLARSRKPMAVTSKKTTPLRPKLKICPKEPVQSAREKLKQIRSWQDRVQKELDSAQIPPIVPQTVLDQVNERILHRRTQSAKSVGEATGEELSESGSDMSFSEESCDSFARMPSMENYSHPGRTSSRQPVSSASDVNDFDCHSLLPQRRSPSPESGEVNRSRNSRQSMMHSHSRCSSISEGEIVDYPRRSRVSRSSSRGSRGVERSRSRRKSRQSWTSSSSSESEDECDDDRERNRKRRHNRNRSISPRPSHSTRRNENNHQMRQLSRSHSSRSRSKNSNALRSSPQGNHSRQTFQDHGYESRSRARSRGRGRSRRRSRSRSPIRY